MNFNTHQFVYLFHMLFFGPLLIYLGWFKEPAEFVKSTALIMGIIAVFYHGWKLHKSMNYAKSD